MIQQCDGITFHACFVEGRSNYNQAHFSVQNMKQKKKKKNLYPKVRGTHINYILSNTLQIFITYSSHYNYYIIANYFIYRIQIKHCDAIDKITFVIFDRDAEKIQNKFERNLTEKQTKVYLI